MHDLLAELLVALPTLLKVRTISRGMETLYWRRALLDPTRYHVFAWKLFSHKICRWALPVSVIPGIIGLAILSYNTHVGGVSSRRRRIGRRSGVGGSAVANRSSNAACAIARCVWGGGKSRCVECALARPRRP